MIFEGTLNGQPALIELPEFRASLLPETYELLRNEKGIVSTIGPTGRRILSIFYPMGENDKWSVTIQHNDLAAKRLRSEWE